jgi:hypothetical protein
MVVWPHIPPHDEGIRIIQHDNISNNYVAITAYSYTCSSWDKPWGHALLHAPFYLCEMKLLVLFNKM